MSDTTNQGQTDPDAKTEDPGNKPTVHNDGDVDVKNSAPTVEADKNEKAYSYEGSPKNAEVDFTYVSHLDPARQRDPNGIYLDDVDRVKAEVTRARIEGREPDLENPPSTVSTQVVPTHVAKGLVDGRAKVPADFSQKIKVGTSKKNLPYNAAAEQSARSEKK